MAEAEAAGGSISTPRRQPAGKYSRRFTHLQFFRSGQQKKYRPKEDYWGAVNFFSGSVVIRGKYKDVFNVNDRFRDMVTGEVFQVRADGVSVQEFETHLNCKQIDGETVEGGESVDVEE